MKKVLGPLANQKGFTLIEMVIVIILLGLLSSMAIPHYLNIQKEAKIAATKGKLSAIRGGLELAHAKILVSGINTGATGDNPDWPTLAEVQRNELFLSTRPDSIRNLPFVRGHGSSTVVNEALPVVNLPDMAARMAAQPAGVSSRTMNEATSSERIASEESGWAYYPGDERTANGILIDAIFYINDDRKFTDNIDGSGNAPADF
ncbi:MAG: prepilin-type N-terminal cleavage/methylation domain-containing protein [Desulfobulbaceae bacterium]|jgi:prepilin-type N-terminal cleavage/methylation domain-containing protein|nr:prepilin-type N-terminal cleavage/methylation domain-containing protein [Desulfobulbaceae bacterium]